MTRSILVATVETGDLPSFVWNEVSRHVTPDEHKKAQNFVFEADRRTYLAAHSLKRAVLSWADQTVYPLDWRFTEGPYGKPSIEGRADLHFNISHCRGLVACALRFGCPVGVDVEWIGRPAPIEVAQHFFSAAEAEWLARQPDTARHHGFFRLWTLKEAYIKAVGRGLLHPLSAFSISVESLTLSSLNSDFGASQEWHFHQACVGTEHILAVAWSEGSMPENVTHVSQSLEAWLRPNRN